MAAMAADGPLGVGARFVARPFGDVPPTDESVSVFPVLDNRLGESINFDAIYDADEFPETNGFRRSLLPCQGIYRSIDAGRQSQGKDNSWRRAARKRKPRRAGESICSEHAVDADFRAARLWHHGPCPVFRVDCRKPYRRGVESICHSKSKGAGDRISQRSLVAGHGAQSRCLCDYFRHGSSRRAILWKRGTLCVASRGVIRSPTRRRDESAVLPTAKRYEVRALGCNHERRRHLRDRSYSNSEFYHS